MAETEERSNDGSAPAPAPATRKAPSQKGFASLQKAPDRRWGRRHWHSLGAKRYPTENALFEGDLTELVREYVLPGHTPPSPVLDADALVVTMGSCFASELRAYLTRTGAAADHLWVPSGLNNTHAILDFVSWCVTGSETQRGFRYDTTSDGEIVEWKPERERAEVLGHLEKAGAFVLTLGLAEIWEDPETGGVFWRGIPDDVFDAQRHVFRLSTVAENERNILEIVELIRRVNATAPIVLTLSPVPLRATFRPISCVTADCVSKSILRVALDAVAARDLHGVYYWPSFEIVKWLGPSLPWPALGTERGSRHVAPYLVSVIIDAFVEAYYTEAAVSELRARSDPRDTSHGARAAGRSGGRPEPQVTEAAERGRLRSLGRGIARFATGSHRAA